MMDARMGRGMVGRLRRFGQGGGRGKNIVVKVGKGGETEWEVGMKLAWEL